MNILITGTNSGIGKSLKKELEQNHKVFKISKTKSKEDDFFHCDLTSKKEIQKLDFGNTIFDVVIFNAGVGYYGDFFKQDIENYEEIIKLNLLSPILLLKNLENNIKKETKIIFLGSVASKKFMKNGSVYIASKFGLRGLAGGLKEEGKKIHIINPIIVDTDFHKGKIELSHKLEYTKIEDIIIIINNIINSAEKRFEIDL